MQKQQISLKAYVLSPDRSVRNSRLLPTLDEFRIPYEFVDGSSVINTLSYLKEIDHPFSEKHVFTKEQYACSFGHLLMHQKALNDDYEWSLFFENDATLNSDLLKVLLNSLSLLPRGIILLGSCGGWARKSFRIDIGGVSIHKVFNSAVTGSHAYLVKTEHLTNMIPVEKELKSLADEFNRRNLPMFIILPFISYQEGATASEIPLRSTSTTSSNFRKLISSVKNDLLDLRRLKRLGNRSIRLEFLEGKVAKFLHILPGCNLYHLTQMESLNDQSDSKRA